MLPDFGDDVQNAALIGDFAVPDFVVRSIAGRLTLSSACLVADDPEILPEIGAEQRLGFDLAALDKVSRPAMDRTTKSGTAKSPISAAF
jgi:hypothetical protein